MTSSPPRSPSPVGEFEPEEPDDSEYEATLHDQYERQLRGVRGRRPIAVVALSASQQLWVVPELGKFPSSFVVVAAVPYHGRLCVACSKCHCFEGSTPIADHIFQYASGHNLLLTALDQASVNRWLDEHACPHVTALTEVPSISFLSRESTTWISDSQDCAHYGVLITVSSLHTSPSSLRSSALYSALYSSTVLAYTYNAHIHRVCLHVCVSVCVCVCVCVASLLNSLKDSEGNVVIV
jgi:hypothetical protein